MWHRDRQRVTLLALYFTLGFVWAVPDFAIPVALQRLGVPIPQVSLWLTLTAIAWAIKWVFGLFSDRYPLCGLHRKSYILVTNTAASVFSCLLALPTLDLGGFIALLALVNTFGCWADVMYDALMTVSSREEAPENRGFLQCMSMTVRDVGGALGGFLGPILHAQGGDPLVFGVQGGVLLLQATLALLLVEGRGGASSSSTQPVAPGSPVSQLSEETEGRLSAFQEFVKTVKNPLLRQLLLFNLLSSLLPSGGTGVFYFLKDSLHFSDKEFGVLGSLGRLARIPVVWFYYYKLRTRNIRLMYLVMVLVSVLVGLLPTLLSSGAYKSLGLPPFFFALSDDVVGDAIDEARSLPLMTITTIVCGEGAEAAAYATMLAFSNLGRGLHAFTDYGVLDRFGVDHNKFENLTAVLTFCALLDLLTAPLLFFLPSGSVVGLAQEQERLVQARVQDVEMRRVRREEERAKRVELMIGEEFQTTTATEGEVVSV